MPRTTAKDVILEILRVCDGEWSGKVKLHKAFYFAHLYYANEHLGFLTDWPIAKLEHGPGIHDDEPLIRSMVNEGLLEIELVHEGPYPEYRYRLTEMGRHKGAVFSDDVRLAIAVASVNHGHEPRGVAVGDVERRRGETVFEAVDGQPGAWSGPAAGGWRVREHGIGLFVRKPEVADVDGSVSARGIPGPGDISCHGITSRA